MGKKGDSKHLKRHPAPSEWPIHTKEKKWTFKPRPGPHPISRCLPLSIAIREVLGYAKNTKEVKFILSEGRVKIDGKIRRDTKYPLGLMDVLEIQDVKDKFRLVPSSHKGLWLTKIDEKETKIKPCRIENKTSLKGGHIMLTLHDGKNILVTIKDSNKPREDIYKNKDTVILSLPDYNILKHIKFQEGAHVIVTGGRNVGRQGKIEAYHSGTATRPGMIRITDQNGSTFQTIAKYVFALGNEQSEVKIAAS